MTRFHALALALSSSFLLSGCYDLLSTEVIPVDASENAVPGEWTGIGPFVNYQYRVMGLNGREIWRIDLDSMFEVTGWEGSEIYNMFGGDYTLTSFAQMHRSSWGDVLIHGNRTGATDEFRFAHTNDPFFKELDWVEPSTTNFNVGGQGYELLEICEIIARPVNTTFRGLDNPDMQAFISFRAKRNGSTTAEVVGGVMEIDFIWDISDEKWLWLGMDTPPGSEEETEIWIRQINGESFSDECMPIAVTRGGKQTVNYLVVGDPSEDEITVFDAAHLSAGPLDSIKESNLDYSITDITVEGRGANELNDNYGFVTTLWGNAENEKRLEHILIMDGDIDNYGPFLEEILHETSSGINELNFIETRGNGADYAQEYIFTLGDAVERRLYRR